MSSDNSLKSSSFESEINPIHARSSGEGPPIPERRKAIEDLSKEELISMLYKLRTQAGTLATERKTAYEMLAACKKEKEEVMNKTLAVVRKAREQEEKRSEGEKFTQFKEEARNKMQRALDKIKELTATRQEADQLAQEKQQMLEDLKNEYERDTDTTQPGSSVKEPTASPSHRGSVKNIFPPIRLTALTAEHSALTAAHDDMKHSLQQINNELDASKAALLDSTERAAADLTHCQTQLLQLHVDLTEQLRACEFRLISSDETLRILEEEKSIFASETEKSKNRLVEVEKSFSNLQSATLTDLQKAAADRESALTDAQNLRDELEKEAEGRFTTATETISALQVRLEQAQAALTHETNSCQVRLAELQQEQEQRMAELKENSKNQLTKAVEKIKALAASRDQQGARMYLCMHVVYLFNVMEQLEFLDSLQARVSEFDQVRSSLTEQLERTQLEKKVIAEEVEKLQNCSSGQNTMYSALVVEIASERQSNLTLLAQLETAVVRMTQLEAEVKDAEVRVAIAEETQSNLTAQLQRSMEETQQNTLTDLQRLALENAQLKEDAKEAAEQMQQLSDNVENKGHEIANLRDREVRLTEVNQQLKDNEVRLTADVVRLNELEVRLTNDLTTLKQMEVNLTQQLSETKEAAHAELDSALTNAAAALVAHRDQ
eukprot:gene28627-37606_t